MPMTFSAYFIQLAEALQAENGPNLAYFLRPTSPHGKDLVKEFRNPTRASLNYYKGSLESPWDDIAIQYVLVTTYIAKKKPEDAFKEQCELVSQFLKFFTANTGWTLPALFSILRDLRDLAFDADLHANAKGNSQKSEYMEEAARIISTKAFSGCVADRTSPPAESRKWGVYYVVGLVLKSYFRVKRISLSRNILRAIEVNEVPPLSSYPRSHQVTFRYYIGMLSFLNEEYAKSEQELTLAFYHCHIDAHSNQERILAYLIPLRILRGHLPSEELLHRFPGLADIFQPFISAIRKGNIKAYDAALEKLERRLGELNLWLILEKARELCIRGLFRRVWVVSEKNTRVPISLFHSALCISGSEVSVEEAECLVANMIYKGFMRGYISHEKQMVVLAGTNTFPKLSDRASPFALL